MPIPSLDILFNCLKNLKEVNNPWTEQVITAVNNFLYDENLYKDCLQDNLSAVKRSADAAYAFYHPKVNFLAIRQERECVAQEIQKLQSQINAKETLYRTLRLNLPTANDDSVDLSANLDCNLPKAPEELVALSESIHKDKMEKDRLNSIYDAKHVVLKDAELLKQSLHYEVGKGSAEGKNASEAIAAFVKNEFLPQPQPTKELIHIYETINALAAMRKRLFSPLENLVTSSDYIHYQSQGAKLTNIPALLTRNFDAKSAEKYKVRPEEHKQLQLDIYLQHLAEGKRCVENMQAVLKQYLTSKSATQEGLAAARSISLILAKAMQAFHGEYDYLQTTMQHKRPYDLIQYPTIRVR